MNNRLHKVIFNRNTGLMAVVAESSHNNGKSSATDSGIAVNLCGLLNKPDCIKISATNALKVAYALQSQTTANNQSHYSVGSEIQAAGKQA
ncbi:MAG: hypothetical protein IJ187_03710 [Neisseriaceae bacterium]|nr:hypothetical protein [Neisseriaceae bacterium]MBQ9725820.1 hypothetical protein [Neisseriaceae bacterium]